MYVHTLKVGMELNGMGTSKHDKDTNEKISRKQADAIPQQVGKLLLT